MTAVLTAASVVQCAHGAPLEISPSQQLLKVDGQPVLVRADLRTATVNTCPNKQAPCVAVASILGGLSTTLDVGGEPVALETANGATATATWLVSSAGQTKLEAA